MKEKRKKEKIARIPGEHKRPENETELPSRVLVRATKHV
jgi:hypothetical protein